MQHLGSKTEPEPSPAHAAIGKNNKRSWSTPDDADDADDADDEIFDLGLVTPDDADDADDADDVISGLG